MYGNASDLVAFRLMPLEPGFHKPVEANWSFQVVDMDRRLVAFKDESYGPVTSWKWEFGDGKTSTDRHPMHQYQKPGEYMVTFYVEVKRNPEELRSGTSSCAKLPLSATPAGT